MTMTRQRVSERAVNATLAALSFPRGARFTEGELAQKTGYSLAVTCQAREELWTRGLIELAGTRPSRGAPREWRVKR